MKIGIDARFYEKGSLGRYAYELIQNLIKLDKKNKYVIFLCDDNFDKFKIEASNLKKINTHSVHYSIAEQFKFLRILLAQKLDLVHFTHFNHPILYPKKFIVTIPDLTLHRYPPRAKSSLFKKIAYRLTIRSAAARSSKVITVSNVVKADIVKYLNISPDKIKVVYEGVDQIYQPIENQAVLDDFKYRFNLENPYILYVGQWRKHKNLVRLIKAYSIYRKIYSKLYDLVLIGKEDPAYPEVKQIIKRLKLEKYVKITGFVDEDDLPKAYNAASLYIIPSLAEGFGLPPLEAMACGTPVAAANVSAMPEILQDAAIYFNPFSPKDIAKVLNSVLSNKNVYNELKNKGIKQAVKYTWTKMAGEMLEVYREVFRI